MKCPGSIRTTDIRDFVSSTIFKTPLCLELTWASKRVPNPTSAHPRENADLRPRHDAQHGKLLPYHKKAYFILQTKRGGGRMEELANGLMHNTTTSALVELRHPTETELTWTGSIYSIQEDEYSQGSYESCCCKAQITMQDNRCTRVILQTVRRVNLVVTWTELKVNVYIFSFYISLHNVKLKVNILVSSCPFEGYRKVVLPDQASKSDCQLSQNEPPCKVNKEKQDLLNDL